MRNVLSKSVGKSGVYDVWFLCCKYDRNRNQGGTDVVVNEREQEPDEQWHPGIR